MIREEAIASESLWAGLVRTDAGMTSGWHHHGAYDTSIYVVSGSLKKESGPGGSQLIEAHPGDFVFVHQGRTAESHPVFGEHAGGPSARLLPGRDRRSQLPRR